MYNLKKCALCGADTGLELSHIIPKMAIRTLKKTAISGIRSTESPNKSVQDSEKHYMLCGNCEDLFSKNETWFANNLFHPYLKKEKTLFNYDERLAYFITSVNWRSLYLDILDFVENNVIGIDALECLISSEKVMNDYLQNKRSDLGSIENHIFFFDEIQELSGDIGEISKLRPHASFHRGITSFTSCYEEQKTYGTISNMMGIVLITLYNKGKEEKWENSKVINGIGSIEARNQNIKSAMGNDFIYIMRTAQEASESMSEAQQKKVLDKIKRVGEEVKKYPVYKDWMDDNGLIK